MDVIIKDPFGELKIIRGFFTEEESQCYFEHLNEQLAFEQQDIVMFGKKIAIPRLESFHSLNGETYGYSGKRLESKPFDQVLSAIKIRIEESFRLLFNSVLVNLYRNENDSNGWHADDEKELGLNPVIASLSLGFTRRFQLKHKESSTTHSLLLGSGDLVIMGGALQHFWKHQVPKEKFICGPRINLTFRFIY